MPFSERGTFAWSGAVYPLPAATTQSLLHDADPALYYALDFCAGVLQIHMGARWAAEATLANRPDLAASVVRNKVPHDPAPYLTQDQLKPPILAIYRTRWKVGGTTIFYEHIESEWQLQYILPPLDVAQLNRLNPTLKAVMDILVNRLHEGSDPAYNNEAQLWVDTSVQEMSVVGGKMGSYQAGGNLVFPAVMMDLSVKERWNYVEGSFGPLTGIDNTVDYKTTDGSVLTDFIEFKT